MKKAIIILVHILLFCLCGESKAKSIECNNQQMKDSLLIITENNETYCISKLILMQGTKKTVLFKIYCEDGSSIDFRENYYTNDHRKIGIYYVYNAAADGNQFLFFDYSTLGTYITFACFSNCFPEKTSLNFKKKELLLQKNNATSATPKKVLYIGSKKGYIICGKKYSSVKANICRIH